MGFLRKRRHMLDLSPRRLRVGGAPPPTSQNFLMSDRCTYECCTPWGGLYCVYEFAAWMFVAAAVFELATMRRLSYQKSALDRKMVTEGVRIEGRIATGRQAVEFVNT